MGRLVLVLGFLLAAFPGDAAQAQDKKKSTLEDDLKALQGTWRQAMGNAKFEMVFRKNEVEVTFGVTTKSEFVLQEKGGKRYISIGFPDAYVPAYIYRLQGDTLIVNDVQGLGPESKLTRVKEKK